MRNNIKNVAFVYVTQDAVNFWLTDDPGYSVNKRPQLGFQYFCSILEKKGIKTNIFDQVVSSFSLDWLCNKLKSYDIAGFYCSDPQEEKVKNYCKKLKEEIGIPILVGGPSTFTNTTFLDYGCDIVVHGEGEITLQHIVEYYNGERPFEEIKGISYKKDNKTITAPAQELIHDLNSLPFPDRSKIDINSYYDYFFFSMKTPYITMIASRGCLYRCSFCTSCAIWRYKYRKRSPQNVLLEIDDAVNKYNIKYIAFQDDVFGVTNEWIEEFCNGLLERPYRIRWMVILHPLSIKKDTEKILRLMREAGCDTLSFGIQSSDANILKSINRDPSEPGSLKRILKIASKLRFITNVSYIIGLPGDTKETIKKTIEYSVACGATLSNYFIFSLLKGSEIERENKDTTCALTKDEVDKLAVYAAKRFYTRPKAILRIAYFIIKNPGWIIKAWVGFYSILTQLGFNNVALKILRFTHKKVKR